MLCVLATFELGRLLYGVRVGLIAAAVLALMPYHVIVSRQVLLDGPQTVFTTVTLCLLIRFARSGRSVWLYAAAAGMGLAVLAKEPSVIFCGAVYAFFALAPEIRVGLRALLLSLAVLGDHDRSLPARPAAVGPDGYGRQLPCVAVGSPAEPQPDLLCDSSAKLDRRWLSARWQR